MHDISDISDIFCDKGHKCVTKLFLVTLENMDNHNELVITCQQLVEDGDPIDIKLLAECANVMIETVEEVLEQVQYLLSVKSYPRST